MRVFLSLIIFSTLLFADFISTTKADTNTTQSTEIKCRCVCDKKISKEEKLGEAIEFYKNSKIYKFSN
jgi:hypothetical protein